MLTIDDVIKLYKEDLRIRFVHKPHPQGLRGEYDPADEEVIIYLAHNESAFDRDMTLLHEFYHAKQDMICNRKAPEGEGLAEKEAGRTYKHRPGVLKAIKELYDIK